MYMKNVCEGLTFSITGSFFLILHIENWYKITIKGRKLNWKIRPLGGFVSVIADAHHVSD